MRVRWIVLGDSLVGDHLRPDPQTGGFGAEVISNAIVHGELDGCLAGVVGSTAAQWRSVLVDGKGAGRVTSEPPCVTPQALRGAVVLLSLGTNDAAGRVRPDLFARDVAAIREVLKGRGADEVILVGANAYPGRSDLAAAAQAAGVPVIDRWREYPNANAHPTRAQHAAPTEKLMELVRASLKARRGLRWFGAALATVIAWFVAREVMR